MKNSINIPQALIDLLNQSLATELGHFHMYSQMANIMQQTGYVGATKYFIAERDEEVKHYQKHVDYLNDLGVLAKMPTLTPMLEDKAMKLRDILEFSYDQMVDLLEFYRKAYSVAAQTGYPDVAAHLNEYLSLQDAAVGYYGDILATMDAEKDNPNINMLIDKRLGKGK